MPTSPHHSSSKTIVLTGATGFIGTQIVEALLKRGDRVRVFSRSQKAMPAGVEVVVAPDGPTAAGLRNADAVIHLAGESVVGLWTSNKRRAIEESRIDGTKKLVRALGDLPTDERPKTLISASAVGFYGDRGDEPLVEGDGSGEGFLAKVCIDWEHEALRAKELGVRVVCLRTGLVMGKSGGSLQAMLPIFKLGGGGPLGDGKQFWPWIHEDDEVSLCLFALDNETVEGPLNASAPEPARQKEFAKTLAGIVHRPSFLPAPAFALRLALQGFADELLASRRVLPHKAQEAGFVFQHPRLEPALRDLLRT